MKKLFLLIMSISTILCCDWGYTQIDGYCYYTSDLNVLQSIVNVNDDLENYINQNNLTPFEFFSGYTDHIGIGWSNNRLETLIIYGSEFEINYLPNNIGDLSALRYFELHNTNVQTIPNSIGDLDDLLGM